ncbi:hypothetical protein BDC45DRAFT_575800 [Circinella umbellata]|nr:hypothetical protein BDC45DRAFT_575800 [Circinella umbellata]
MVRLFEILQQILVKSLDRETQVLDAVKSMCDANIKVYQEILNTTAAKSDTNPKSSIRSFDEEKYQRTMEFTEQLKKLEKG